MLNCTYSHNPLALPLGELSLQATERVLGQRLPSPSSLRSDTYPKGRDKTGYGERKFLAHICQSSRERSKKTEAVFLVGSRESEGKSKSPQARFLFSTFSFGEAKEKVGPQSQICRRVSAFCQFPSSDVPGTAFGPPYRKSAGRKVRSAPSVCLGGYSSSVGIPVTTGRPSAFSSGVRPPPLPEEIQR